MQTITRKSGRNKRGSYKKRLIALLMLVFTWVSAIGAGISENDHPKLSLKDNPVYTVCDLDTVSQELKDNYEQAFSKYDDHAIAVSLTCPTVNDKGLIVAKTAKGMEIILEGTKEVAGLGNYTDKDKITAFGSLKIGKEKGKEKTPDLSLVTQWTSKMEVPDKANYYTVVDEHPKAYFNENSMKYTFGNDYVEFMVPNTWEDAILDADRQAELFNKKLKGNAECFVLDKLLSNDESHEFFLVFYFDKEQFVYDTKANDEGEIETAIIQNICPESGFNKLVSAIKKGIYKDKTKSDEGNDIIYYVTNYRDPKGSNSSCKVEFIITEAKKGFVVMMYVTDSDYNFKEDVLYIQKTLIFHE